MTKKQLTIHITGNSASGKSTVADLIRDTLKLHNIEVDLILNEDFKDDAHFKKVITDNRAWSVPDIAKKTKVTILDNPKIL